MESTVIYLLFEVLSSDKQKQLVCGQETEPHNTLVSTPTPRLVNSSLSGG